MSYLSVGLDASMTTGPIEGSRKVYRELAAVPGARVPFRRVEVTNGEHIDLYLYDTSGRGPGRLPRKWRSQPNARVCVPGWFATRWRADGP
jgi:hypothetical protein